MSEGRVNEAVRAYYELSNDEELDYVQVNGVDIKKLATVGLKLSADYAGPDVIFLDSNKEAYDLANAYFWTSIDVDAIEKALEEASPFSSEDWEGAVADGLATRN